MVSACFSSRSRELSMSNLNHNFIAGNWLAGASEVANINPSDLSDTIGHYAQADADQLQLALDAAAAAQREWAKLWSRAALQRVDGDR